MKKKGCLAWVLSLSVLFTAGAANVYAEDSGAEADQSAAVRNDERYAPASPFLDIRTRGARWEIRSVSNALRAYFESEHMTDDHAGMPFSRVYPRSDIAVYLPSEPLPPGMSVQLTDAEQNVGPWREMRYSFSAKRMPFRIGYIAAADAKSCTAVVQIPTYRGCRTLRMTLGATGYPSDVEILDGAQCVDAELDDGRGDVFE